MKLALSLIVVPDRMRKDYGDIADLAESIRTYGQIQPIVIDQNNTLIAGGRRLAAHALLKAETIDIVYRETLTPDENKMLELEENVRRKEMDWKERVLAIDEIHRLKSRDAALGGTTWGMRETGELLGVALCSVGYASQVASQLRAANPIITKCASVREALQALMSQKEDEANKLLAATTVRPVNINILNDFDHPEPVVPASADETIIDLSRMLFRGSCLDLMAKLPSGSIDHIVSDPPYGIDMEMLDQSNPPGGPNNIDRVAAEHDVLANQELFASMLPLMFNILKPNGFCVLWCDIMQWQRLYDLGVSAGFRVQRWPITWVKTHTCMNQCAQYNYTKSTEIAIVMRKAGATLVQPQSGCHVLSSNDTMGLQHRHPFAKPANIWNYIFQAIAIRGQVVLDPFAGVGSSTCAAINYGLSPLAFELVDNHYASLVENVRTTYLNKFGSNIKFQ